MRKIAIMDVGSNNARLILVYIYDNGSYRIADQLKETGTVDFGYGA